MSCSFRITRPSTATTPSRLTISGLISASATGWPATSARRESAATALGERGDVAARQVAVAADRREALSPRAIIAAASVLGHRREAQRVVAVDLGQRAARADEHDRPDERVVAVADDRFGEAVTPCAARARRRCAPPGALRRTARASALRAFELGAARRSRARRRPPPSCARCRASGPSPRPDRRARARSPARAPTADSTTGTPSAPKSASACASSSSPVPRQIRRPGDGAAARPARAVRARRRYAASASAQASGVRNAGDARAASSASERSACGVRNAASGFARVGDAEDRLDRELRDETAPTSRPPRAPRRRRASASSASSTARYFWLVPASVRSMIGASETRTPSAESCAQRSSGATVSMPERAQAVDDARGAAAGRGHDGDARRARELRRLAAGDERRDLDQRLEHVDAHDAAVAEVGVDRARRCRRARRCASARAPRRAPSGRACRRRPVCPRHAPRAAARASRAASRTVSRNSRITRVSRVVDEQLDQLADAEVGFVADRRPAWRSRGRAPRRARARVPSMVPLCETTLVVPARQRVHLQHRVDGQRDAARRRRPGRCCSARAGARRARVRAPTSRACRAAPSAPASAKPSL